MITVNENFLKLQDSYLFVTISEKVREYQSKHPEKEIIKLGIGDVTRPIPEKVAEAMKKAIDEMLDSNTFKGYGPEVGYDFLKEKIIENDYKKRMIDFENYEIFISDGIGTDIGNIVDIFFHGTCSGVSGLIVQIRQEIAVLLFIIIVVI